VGAPSVDALKSMLEGALGSLSWWVAALPMAEGWKLMGFKIPSNLSHSMKQLGNFKNGINLVQSFKDLVLSNSVFMNSM